MGVFFARLLLLEYPDHHQNLISSSLYYKRPLHKISSQSVNNFLSNVVHRQTDRQTNGTKNITSFAKEVISTFLYTRSPYYYSHFEIFICTYNVRGEIDQISTNTSRYNICCAANVYMFVYIFMGAHLAPFNIKHSVPLRSILKLSKMYEEVFYSGSCFVLSLLVESQKILFSDIRTTLTVTKDYVYMLYRM